MKHIKSTPKDRGFYDIYARLSKSISTSGYFAQVVSALTEIGGIFAASLSMLQPIFGNIAIYAAATIAILGTVTLEVGLRVVIPQMVDAVLYKRWQGLHLAMSIAVFILGMILLGTSGILSYKNSQTVVDTVVQEPTIDSTKIVASKLERDSAEAKLIADYRREGTAITRQFQNRTETTEAAYKGKLGSAKRELSNVYNKERRTGNSYATAKDKARQKIADVKAEQAAALAAITAERGKALTALKAEHKAAIAQLQTKYSDDIAEIKSDHQAASTERDNTVTAYGGGLAYFTIICLFIFLSSVILERIHHKGSGIKETIELSQYDISPAWYTEGWNAFKERVQTNIRSRIAAFAEKTPAAPLPTSPNELYDPTTLANLEIALRLKMEEGEDEDRVIEIEPKRRQIGFQTRQTRGGTHTKKPPNSHKISRAIKGTPNPTHETRELRELKQRLKDYKKRLGKHEQKAKAQERNRGEATTRTLQAIENNRHWVEHYTALINQAEATK